jgi:hypothetical protein
VPSAAPPGALSGGSRALQRQYAETYQRLLQYGFRPDQVQSALRALPLGAGAQLEAALDWLCLSLPQSQLPRRFAGAARGGGGGAGGGGIRVRRLRLGLGRCGGAPVLKLIAVVPLRQSLPIRGRIRCDGRRPKVAHALCFSQVLATTNEAGGSSRGGEPAPSGSGADGAGGSAEEVGSQEEEGSGSGSGSGSDGGGGSAQGSGGSRAGVAPADEKAATKAWILQQYGGGSDAEYEGSGDDEPSEDSVIEDWELWGDPREIEVGVEVGLRVGVGLRV